MTDQNDIFSKLGAIAVIGGGRMGEAIVAGLVQGAMLDPAAVTVADPSPERRAHFSQTYGVACWPSGVQISDPQTCILAVKPHGLREVATELAQAPRFAPERVVSIAAGISTAVLKSIFGSTQVIRVMPNAPLQVGAGISVVALAPGDQIADGKLVQALFSLMGEALLLGESLIDAATALSGSGPAYFALFVEKLADAGRNLGLSADTAAELALQTFIGTARWLQLTGLSPAELRAFVTSPGGTTQAALDCLRDNDLAGVVQKAVNAAHDRAIELR